MTQTTQTTKANAKAATKASPKAATKAAAESKVDAFTLYQIAAAGLAKALAGEFGSFAKAYYMRAQSYHKAQSTQFPRGRTAEARAEILADAKKGAETIRAVFERAAKGTLAAGSGEGQAVYDMARMQAPTGK